MLADAPTALSQIDFFYPAGPLYPHHMQPPQIYLASASPRRSALLTQIGLEHRVQAVNIDESLMAGEAPIDYVCRLARSKAQVLWDRLSCRGETQPKFPLVLGADTAVVFDGQIYGKPADREEGLRMLQRLSGRTHRVHTAVALCCQDWLEHRCSISEVSFRELTLQECAAYWDTGEPFDKAGGYAVQGRAAAFISYIAGSYSGVMGLPLYETSQLLLRAGYTVSSMDNKERQS